MRENNLSAALVSSDRENKAVCCKDSGSLSYVFPASRLHLNPPCDCTPDISWNAHVERKTSGTHPKPTERKPFTAAGVLSPLPLLVPYTLPMVSQLSNFSSYFNRGNLHSRSISRPSEAPLTDNVPLNVSILKSNMYS